MIRRSFTANTQRAEQYVQGVLALKDPQRFPWTAGLSAYDFFVFWHARTMMTTTPPTQSDRNAAHSGPVFLPWHRYMLLRFEFFLRAAVGDDDFRLPYWDWTQDAELTDPRLSAVWSENRLGRFERSDFRVRIGVNATGGLVQVDRTLRRSRGSSGALPSRLAVRQAIDTQPIYDSEPYNSDSAGFRNRLEGWIGPGQIHNSVHVWVGGDMVLAISPSDPAFFLHHCQVDRIWSAWQRRWPSSMYVPSENESTELRFHRRGDPMFTYFNEQVPPEFMLDHGSWYEYDTLSDLVS